MKTKLDLLTQLIQKEIDTFYIVASAPDRCRHCGRRSYQTPLCPRCARLKAAVRQAANS